ncbi:MAG: GNAT family N-acetyltransferase [Promethearchaeota archaeon]
MTIEFRRELQLKDGTPVLIRMYEPDDIDEVREGLKKISDSSFYLRFMTSLGKLPDAQLKKLKRIDQDHHLAICAFDISQDPMVGIGIARYVCCEGEPEVAEAAVTVIDEFQNRGLGTQLLQALAELADANGIQHLRAHVLSNNTPILTIAERAGAQIQHYDGAVLQIDLPVSAALGR